MAQEGVESMITGQYRHSNGSDTILILRDGKIIGTWEVKSPEDLRNYIKGDFDGWEVNCPGELTEEDSQDPDEYGDLVEPGTPAMDERIECWED